MDTLEFLRFTITAREAGWLRLGASLPNGQGWRQYWRGWPDDAESAVELIQGLKDEGLNVYYSCHLYSEKDGHKAYVIDSRTLFVDLDEAEPALLKIRPSMLVKSSNNNHQCYYHLNQWITKDRLEEISRRVSWGIDKADHTGWPLGHMMRVPNTYNYKYVPQQKVRVFSYNKNVYDAVDFNIFPPLAVSEQSAIIVDPEWIEEALKIPAGHHNLTYFWDSVKDRLAKGTEIHFYNEAPDRSKALWRLMTECFRAGLTREETYLLAYHSKNNKFRDLRYGDKLALAKDVLRAERVVFSGPEGIRGRINDARRLGGPVEIRRQGIAEMCRNQMLAHGRFINARGGTLWYILDSEGKPIQISRSSLQLNVLLDNMFALNATEGEHQYVVASLMNYTANLPQTGEISSLSYYIEENNTLLLHTGQKNVLRVTKDNIDLVSNGYKNIIFQWTDQNLEPNLKGEPNECEDLWHDAVFGISLSNLAPDSLSPEHAMAILRVWFITILIRNAVLTRPILALFGQKGSGKSTLFNRVYALFYGPHRKISGLGTQQDFDHAMSVDPLLVLDNLDTWEKWLPDRLARAAGVSEIIKRKLYTDTDTIIIRLQAYLGVTSLAPKFGREDVVDRMLMLTFERIQNRIDETAIVKNVLDKRDMYWGQITRDIQKVLAEPDVPMSKVAQFRIQDFAKLGQRIANALEFGPTFHEAITIMVDQQKGFMLDEDSILVNLIDDYVRSPRYKNWEFQTPAKLWGIFDTLGGMDKTFSKQYGNSIKLGRKLWAMQDALKQRFVIEWQFDSKQKARVWRFKERDSDSEV